MSIENGQCKKTSPKKERRILYAVHNLFHQICIRLGTGRVDTIKLVSTDQFRFGYKGLEKRRVRSRPYPLFVEKRDPQNRKSTSITSGFLRALCLYEMTVFFVIIVGYGLDRTAG